VNTVSVRVRDCACPGHPHSEGDVVFLREKASLPLGLAIQSDMAYAIRAVPADQVASLVTARWVVSYVLHGATGWNFLDERGEPVPFDPQALIDDYTLGRAVGERADQLYGDVVVKPLLPKPQRPSGNGSMERPTSATPPSTPTPRRRSSRAASAATEPSTP
jgi:hypothetical protein